MLVSNLEEDLHKISETHCHPEIAKPLPQLSELIHANCASVCQSEVREKGIGISTFFIKFVMKRSSSDFTYSCCFSVLARACHCSLAAIRPRVV